MTVSVTLDPKEGFTGNLQFTLSLRSSNAGPLAFTNSMATVIIVDNEGETSAAHGALCIPYYIELYIAIIIIIIISCF